MPKSAQTFGQTFWVCLCFWMRLTFESVNWVKQLPSLMWVNPMQSVKGLNRAKSLTPPWVRGDSCCLTAFEMGHWVFFLPLNSNWNAGFSWVSRRSGLGLDPHCRLWVSRLPVADLGTCQPPWSREPISYDKSLCICLYIQYMHAHVHTHTHARTHTHTTYILLIYLENPAW